MRHVSCGIIFEDAAIIDEITKNIIFMSFIFILQIYAKWL